MIDWAKAACCSGLAGAWYFLYGREGVGLPTGLVPRRKDKEPSDLSSGDGKTHITVDVGSGESGITREYDVGRIAAPRGRASWLTTVTIPDRILLFTYLHHLHLMGCRR